MFLGNHCKFQWFWRDHCKFSMVFEETITIECFWAVWPLPSMVLRWFFDVATIAFNGFRWFQTIGQTMRWFRWIVVVYVATWCLCFRRRHVSEGKIPVIQWESVSTERLSLNFGGRDLKRRIFRGVTIDLSPAKSYGWAITGFEFAPAARTSWQPLVKVSGFQLFSRERKGILCSDLVMPLDGMGSLLYFVKNLPEPEAVPSWKLSWWRRWSEHV